MAGDIKLKLGTDAAFTMTGIEDVDSSTTLVGGWSTGSVDNTTTLASDYLVSGQFTLESSNRSTTGFINVYAYGTHLDTPVWPDLFSAGTEGTVGAATVHDAYRRDAGMYLVQSIYVGDNTASAVYTMKPTSLRDLFGQIPALWALWVTSNACTTTADWCVASGTTLYYVPVLQQYT
jgi:hypothetical protein